MEVGRLVKGRVAANKDERELTLWNSYHTALFTRAKKLPKFSELIKKDRPRRKGKRTSEDIYYDFMEWHHGSNRISKS